jgi:hypothetical protein
MLIFRPCDILTRLSPINKLGSHNGVVFALARHKTSECEIHNSVSRHNHRCSHSFTLFNGAETTTIANFCQLNQG